MHTAAESTHTKCIYIHTLMNTHTYQLELGNIMILYLSVKIIDIEEIFLVS